MKIRANGAVVDRAPQVARMWIANAWADPVGVEAAVRKPVAVEPPASVVPTTIMGHVKDGFREATNLLKEVIGRHAGGEARAFGVPGDLPDNDIVAVLMAEDKELQEKLQQKASKQA